MEQKEKRSAKQNLAECALRVEELKMRLEQDEKDYASLLKQKQNYLYENLAWIAVFLGAIIVTYILNYFYATLPTGSMLLPFCTAMEFVNIFLLAHVIYLSRHFIGMRDYKRAKFVTFRELIDDQTILIQNTKKLLARAEKTLGEAQAQADAAAMEEKTSAPEEERMVERWDQQDTPATGTSGSISDTARLIREALEQDE